MRPKRLTRAQKIALSERGVNRKASVRSKTFPGIARAMAEQYSAAIDGEKEATP